jgi:hypothetical protein
VIRTGLGAVLAALTAPKETNSRAVRVKQKLRNRFICRHSTRSSGSRSLQTVIDEQVSLAPQAEIGTIPG